MWRARTPRALTAICKIIDHLSHSTHTEFAVTYFAYGSTGPFGVNGAGRRAELARNAFTRGVFSVLISTARRIFHKTGALPLDRCCCSAGPRLGLFGSVPLCQHDGPCSKRGICVYWDAACTNLAAECKRSTAVAANLMLARCTADDRKDWLVFSLADGGSDRVAERWSENCPTAAPRAPIERGHKNFGSAIVRTGRISTLPWRVCG